MRNFPSTSIVYSILQDAATPNTIYLGTINGIYRSLDRGASWAAVKAQNTRTATRRRSGAAKSGKTAVAATKKPSTIAGKKSAANIAANPAPKPLIKVAALTGKVTALIPTYDGKNGMWAATDVGLFRTSNISSGWESVRFPEGMHPQILTIAVSPNNPKIVWAGTAKSGVLFSRDGGTTWEQEKSISTIYPIAHIEADLQDANRVYIGTKQTLFVTRDGGEKWERRGGGLPAGDYNSIVINPSNPDEIFAASAQENRDGLFHSIDGGKKWERADPSGLNLPSRRIWALSFDPRNPNLLLIGSHSAGIYRVERTLTASTN